MSLPERLGRLRRVERLGVGGFASVWLYHDAELRSDVAVKALADNWAQRLDVRERFVEEARILRRADSDHIVRVYDVGEADGTPYFVMSYADRGSLGPLVEAGRPVEPARVLDLVEQAAAGLRVLHGLGVVHRDITPHNLLLRSTADGGERLLVADLGVAKALLHASGLTQVVGTPAYMAPEQATGEPIDVRADVHALGAVAYHLLTGHPARRGSVAEVARAVPARPAGELADLPAGLEGVLARALAPEPAHRWPDVDAFALALRGVVPVPEPGPGTRGAVTVWQGAAAPALEGTTLGGLGGDAGRDARAPRWPLVLISLLVAVACFGVAYAATSLLS